jgi:hypothetical protein
MQEIKLSLLETGFQTTGGARAADSELAQYQTIHIHGGQALPTRNPFKCTRGTVAPALAG